MKRLILICGLFFSLLISPEIQGQDSMWSYDQLQTRLDSLRDQFQSQDMEEIQLNYFRIGTIRLKEGQFPESLAYFDSVDVYFRRHPNKDLLISYLAKKAYALAGVGQTEAALEIGREAIQLGEEQGQTELLAEVYNDVGLMYAIINDAPNCAKTLLKGYVLAKELHLWGVVASLSNNLTILFTYLQQFEQAKKYNQEAIRMCDILQLNAIKTKVLFNRVSLSMELNELDSARWYLDQVMSQDLDPDYALLKPYVETIRGDLAWKSGDYEAAYQLYQTAEGLARVSLDKKAELEAGMGIVQYLAHTHQYEEALEILSEIIPHPLVAAIDKKDCLDLQAAAYENIGAYQKAYEAQQWSNKIQDTVLSLERIGIAVSIAADYELRTKENEIEQLEIENELAKQKNVQNQRLIIGLVIFSLLIAALGYYLSRHRRLTLEKDLAEVKENLLRLQINPHFIFNSLNSIQSSFLQEDEEKTIHLFSKFSNLMRQVLHNSELSFVPLSEELQLLINYLELEKIRSNNRFDYHIEIDEHVNMYQVQVPSMILQIFIENAIWHGIGLKEDRGNIHIFVREENGRYKIVIEDDGVGRSFSIKHKSEDQKTKQSLGTQLARQRLQQLNRKYGKRLSLAIQDRSNGQGTRVEIMT